MHFREVSAFAVRLHVASAAVQLRGPSASGLRLHVVSHKASSHVLPMLQQVWAVSGGVVLQLDHSIL